MQGFPKETVRSYCSLISETQICLLNEPVQPYRYQAGCPDAENMEIQDPVLDLRSVFRMDIL